MANSVTTTPATVGIDVVICTYNRAANLDAVLSALSAQRIGRGVVWSVLVVDNASTDRTVDVVEAHRSRRLLPGLRVVREDELGLTPARRRGVREASAPWIAFVDDDNLVEPGWLDAIAQVARSHPEAGGIGGRVILDWEERPRTSSKTLASVLPNRNPTKWHAKLTVWSARVWSCAGQRWPSADGSNARCWAIASVNASFPVAMLRSRNASGGPAIRCGSPPRRYCVIAFLETAQAGGICFALTTA